MSDENGNVRSFSAHGNFYGSHATGKTKGEVIVLNVAGLGKNMIVPIPAGKGIVTVQSFGGETEFKRRSAKTIDVFVKGRDVAGREKLTCFSIHPENYPAELARVLFADSAIVEQ